MPFCAFQGHQGATWHALFLRECLCDAACYVSSILRAHTRRETRRRPHHRTLFLQSGVNLKVSDGQRSKYRVLFLQPSYRRECAAIDPSQRRAGAPLILTHASEPCVRLAPTRVQSHGRGLQPLLPVAQAQRRAPPPHGPTELAHLPVLQPR